jgi:hypothetical protein
MRSSLLSLLLALPLAACTSSGLVPDPALHLQNPYVRYAEEAAVVDGLTSIEILPLAARLTTEQRQALAVRKAEAIRRTEEAQALIDTGRRGAFVPAQLEVTGRVALLGDVLYVGPDFFSPGGVDVRLMLTTVVDPRDGAFPDETAMDVGALPYVSGAWSLPVALPEGHQFRTVVLYDRALGIVQGFAQI